MEHLMTTQQDLWSAMLPGGDVRSGTLEQLREAFRSGHVGAGTLVSPSGSNNWTRLADVIEAPAAAALPSDGWAAAPSHPAPAPVQPVSSPIDAAGAQWQVRLASGEV